MKKNLLIVLVCCVAFAFLTAGITPANSAASAPGGVFLFNPYRGIDWDVVERHRASLHSHTTMSDGNSAPAAHIRAYQNLGFSFLAIADHDYVTYPWANYGHIPSPTFAGPFEGNLIQAIQANEFSGHEINNNFFRNNPAARNNRPGVIHHTVSMFNDFVDDGTHANFRDLMDDATAHNDGAGRFFLAHPNRYTTTLGGSNVSNHLNNPNHRFNLDFYTEMFERFPTMLGVEIYNRDRYPESRIIWDRILSATMPYRPVWGIAADDNHGSHYGWHFTTMLLEEATVDNFRCALERGAFFSSSFGGNPAVFDRTATPGSGRYEVIPEVDRIEVNQQTGYITITGRQYTDIIWTTNNGFEAGRGASVNFRTNPRVSRYLRATLVNQAGDRRVETHTQPFGVGEFNEDSWFFHFAGVDFGLQEHSGPGPRPGCGSGAAAGGLVVLFVSVALLFIAGKRR